VLAEFILQFVQGHVGDSLHEPLDSIETRSKLPIHGRMDALPQSKEHAAAKRCERDR